MHQKTLNALAFELPAIIALVVVPYFFIPSAKVPLFILLTLAVALSRSSLLYDSVRVEAHMFIVIVLSNIYGAWVGLFLGLTTLPLLFRFSKTLFKFKANPVFMSIDTITIAVIGLIAVFIPFELLPLYGMLALLVVDHIIVGFVRLATLPYPLFTYAIRGMVDLTVTYFLLLNYALPLATLFV